MYHRHSLFFLEQNNIPALYNQESATNVALYLIEYISNPSPAVPFATIGEEKLQSIGQLEEIFKQNTIPQSASHKDTPHTRVEVINNNPPKTTSYMRVNIPSNLPNPAPTPRQSPKQHIPTPIFMYEVDEYTPPRVETEPVQGGSPSYNTRHQT